MNNSPARPLARSPALILCGMCREEFDEDRAQPTCQACPLSRACKYVRCPHCGYENPVVPGWVKTLRDFVRHDTEKHRSSV